MTTQHAAEFEAACRAEAARMPTPPVGARVVKRGRNWSAHWQWENGEAWSAGSRDGFATEAQALAYARMQIPGFDPVI